MAKETRNVHINVTSNASKNLTKSTTAATGLSGALGSVGTSANIATGGIRAMATALISSGVGAFALVLGGVIGAFTGLIGKSKEFSRELSTLGAISGATGAEMNALKQNAKDLGSTTAFTAVEVLQLSTELAKLGFDSGQIVSASKGILDLAAATGSDLSEAASIAAGTLRGFGLEASETGRVADVMANSFSKSGLDIEKFKESMKLVAPIAKTTNITLEQSTAALSVLADRQISGSMAGTQLRRIMSDLAMKTGKDFQTSLEDTAEKLENASSSSEKLAIAKKLVGDRAKGSLIALAENAGAVRDLAVAYEEVGVAGDTAAKMLDNLDGDSKKLSSAWEGLMLSVEDGDGILTKIARGGVQLLTSSIEFFRLTSMKLSLMWINFTHDLQRAGTMAGSVGDMFKKFGLRVASTFLDIKEKAQGIPFIGDTISQEKINAQRKAILKGYDDLAKGVIDRNAKLSEIEESRKKDIIALYTGEALASENANKNRVNQTITTNNVLTEEEKKRLKKEKELREDFIAKFRKMEEDAEDKSNADKIRRKKERHLKELDALVMDTTEKAKLKNDIETYYAGLLELDKQKAIEKIKGQLGSEDPIDKINSRRDKHLAELDAIEMEEIEKRELKKQINDYYDGLETEATNALTLKKNEDRLREAQEEERLRQQKIQGMYDVLDAASTAAGQESDIARALQAVKLAIMISELAVKFKIIKQGLFAKAQAAMTESTIEGAKAGTAVASGAAETAKVGFPQNIPMLIGFAVQAAALITSFNASKKTLKGVTSGIGGGSVGGGGAVAAPAAPPSFNVIGQATSGENMIADTIATTNNKPMRAYVVENDISNSQSLRRKTETIASL